MSDEKSSMYPCPICSEQMFVVGKTKNNMSLTSCSHKFKFKKSKAAKVADREWVKTAWGMERLSSVDSK